LASKKGVSDEAEFASALSAPFHDILLAVFSAREKRQFITRLPFERALVIIILTVPSAFLGTTLRLVLTIAL
jgi:hypothetical protein